MLTAVTGATGFIGGQLVRALRSRGRAVRALVRKRSERLDALGVEQCVGDVRDGQSVRRALEGVSRVHHLAAVISIAGDRGGEVSETNIVGVREVTRAALDAGVERFVHYSSIHAFELVNHEGSLRETCGRPGPRSGAYDRSKYAGEEEVRGAVAGGLDAVILNPAGVIGPGDTGPSRLGQLFLDLRRRRVPALVNGGCLWVDVRDVVAAGLAAEERGQAGENYLLVAAWHTVADLAAFAEDATGVPAPRWIVPMWLARWGVIPLDLSARMVGIELQFSIEAMHALRCVPDFDCSKAAAELGFEGRPLAETIRDFYAWHDGVQH